MICASLQVPCEAVRAGRRGVEARKVSFILAAISCHEFFDEKLPERRATLLYCSDSEDEGLEDGSGAIKIAAEQRFRIARYFERAGAGQQCQSRQGMWRLPMSDEHKCVLVSVAEMLGSAHPHSRCSSKSECSSFKPGAPRLQC